MHLATLPKLVLDSASLITVAKFVVDGCSAAELIAQRCLMLIPPAVHREIALAAAAHPDAAHAYSLVVDGRMTVQAPTLAALPDLDTSRLGKGEVESILLTLTRPDIDYLIVDDQLASMVSEQLGIRTIFALDLLTELVWTGRCTRTGCATPTGAGSA